MCHRRIGRGLGVGLFGGRGPVLADVGDDVGEHRLRHTGGGIERLAGLGVGREGACDE
ncbi:MAG: hypothetical protein AB7L91_16385 [Dehalococcoidia bacterium]